MTKFKLVVTYFLLPSKKNQIKNHYKYVLYTLKFMLKGWGGGGGFKKILTVQMGRGFTGEEGAKKI